MPLKKNRLPPWSGSSRDADALERPETTVNRVRRKLNAARLQQSMSWEDLFALCDQDKSKTVDWRECQHMCREILKVPVHVIADPELRIVFAAADADSNGSLDVAEFLAFLWHGPKTKEMEAAREKMRIARVRRNLFMAFAKVGSTEAAVRRLFDAVDLDGNSRLSSFEFDQFVRRELALSPWHIMKSDLDCFYRFLDNSGEGVDAARFLEFVRQAQRPKSIGGPESFFTPGESRAIEFKRRVTFVKELERSLPRSESLPAPRVSGSAFTSLGRDRPPRSRVAVDHRLF